jgi:hypothetical protein
MSSFPQPLCCTLCSDSTEVFCDQWSLVVHYTHYHADEKMTNQVTHIPSPIIRDTDAPAGDNSPLAATRIPKEAKAGMVIEDAAESFPGLKGFNRLFIVQFNMFGPDMSVEKVGALTEEAKLKLRAFVPSQLYLTAYRTKEFKKTLRCDEKGIVLVVHAKRILSCRYLQKEDVDSKIPSFIAATKALKAEIAKAARAAMRSKNLSAIRMFECGKYLEISTHRELVKKCAVDEVLRATVIDLLHTTVYPLGGHSNFTRGDLASALIKSCGFVFDDGLATKDCILLHVSEIWSSVLDEFRKSGVSSGTGFCLFICTSCLSHP